MITNFSLRVRAPRAPERWEKVRACMMRAGQQAPKNGDRLYFYFLVSGLQQQLGRGTCKSAPECELTRNQVGQLDVRLDGLQLLRREVDWLADESGFGSSPAMLRYFETTYGLPFNGTLLRW